MAAGNECSLCLYVLIRSGPENIWGRGRGPSRVLLFFYGEEEEKREGEWGCDKDKGKKGEREEKGWEL